MRPFAKTPKIDGKKIAREGTRHEHLSFWLLFTINFPQFRGNSKIVKIAVSEIDFFQFWANSSQFYVKRVKFPGGTVVCFDGLFWYLPSACLPFCLRPVGRGGPQSKWKAGGGFPFMWLRHRRPPRCGKQMAVFVGGPLLAIVVLLGEGKVFWLFARW